MPPVPDKSNQYTLAEAERLVAEAWYARGEEPNPVRARYLSLALHGMLVEALDEARPYVNEDPDLACDFSTIASIDGDEGIAYRRAVEATERWGTPRCFAGASIAAFRLNRFRESCEFLRRSAPGPYVAEHEVATHSILRWRRSHREADAILDKAMRSARHNYMDRITWLIMLLNDDQLDKRVRTPSLDTLQMVSAPSESVVEAFAKLHVRRWCGLAAPIEAQELAEHLVATFGDSRFGAEIIVEALVLQGETARARAWLTTYAERNPESSFAWRYLASFLDSRCDPTDAVSAFARALSLAPEDLYLRRMASLGRLARGQVREGLRLFRSSFR